MKTLAEKNIASLAWIISHDWKKVNYAAKPYLDAMYSLDNISDAYGYDSGQSIVRYFLSNAGAWRGDVAKAVKAELNNRLKGGSK